MTNLRYCIRSAYSVQEKKHPQLVMQNLGITYQVSTPQTIADQWWFWNCENVPTELPIYLELLELDPQKCIGYGLSKQEADLITNH